MRSGVPSVRLRLWPTGYSIDTSSRTVPSLSVRVIALPIERDSGSCARVHCTLLIVIGHADVIILGEVLVLDAVHLSDRQCLSAVVR